MLEEALTKEFSVSEKCHNFLDPFIETLMFSSHCDSLPGTFCNLKWYIILLKVLQRTSYWWFGSIFYYLESKYFKTTYKKVK